MHSAEMPAVIRFVTKSWLKNGSRKLASIAPGLRAATMSGAGGWTANSRSAVGSRPARAPTLTPAAAYSVSALKIDVPRPDSTATSAPKATSLAALCGVTATRRSPGTVSVSATTFIKRHDYTFMSARLPAMGARLYWRLMKRPVTHIGVLTSGGDAPGMNAAIRAVVRTASHDGFRVSGIYRVFQGLLDDDIEELGVRSVANIIQRGGTVLRTARCEEFYQPAGRARAAERLRARGIDGLVVIGGDGSFRGAQALHEEHGVAVIGVPATIDNDIYGTDVSIGFNTATDFGVDAVDRLRDTAASHDRLFLVEVMGRRAGHIALAVGVAGGAEAILIPEVPTEAEQIADLIVAAQARGKSSSLIVVAEGAYPGGATALQKIVEEKSGYE